LPCYGALEIVGVIIIIIITAGSVLTMGRTRAATPGTEFSSVQYDRFMFAQF